MFVCLTCRYPSIRTSLFKTFKWYLLYMFHLMCDCAWHHYCEAWPKCSRVMPLFWNSHISIYSYFLWQSLGVYSSQTVIALVRIIKQLLIRFLHARLFVSLCENVENVSLIVPYLNSPCLFSRIISKLNISRIIPDLQYSTFGFLFWFFVTYWWFSS